MKKKNIYIPIEILVRETNPKILFALKAALQTIEFILDQKQG